MQDIIKELQIILKPELAQLKSLISDKLKSDVPLIEEVAEHLISGRGKLLRPLLLLLSSRIFGYEDAKEAANIKLACAVEFIHSATLMHDDVVDSSQMRRNKPCAHELWGNKTSILVGDFLFSQSFQLMVSSGSLRAMGSLSGAARIISEGEVRQLIIAKKGLSITQKDYIEIIESKTGALFGSAFEIGAIISSKSGDIENLAREYGVAVGNIFQISDDILDYLGNTRLLGKNIGDDFAENKITLPIISLFQLANQADRANLTEIFASEQKPDGAFEHILELMDNYKIQKYIEEKYLKTLKNRAHEYIDEMKIDKQHSAYLSSIVDYAYIRAS